MNIETKTTSKHWTTKLQEENKELKAQIADLRANQVAVLASRYAKMKTYFPKPATQYELGYQAACNEISMRLDEFYLYGRRSR